MLDLYLERNLLNLNYIHSFYLDKVDITLSGDAYYTMFQNQTFPDYDKTPELSFVYLENENSKNYNYTPM